MPNEKNQINVMTGLAQKKFLGFSYSTPCIEKHTRNEAMDIWAESVRKFSYPLIFLHPDFEKFNRNWNQQYAFVPTDDIDTKWPKREEIDFFKDIFNQMQDSNISAYIPAGFWGEEGFLKPLNEIKNHVQYLPKETVIEK